MRKTKKADSTVSVITHLPGWSWRKPVIMEFHFSSSELSLCPFVLLERGEVSTWDDNNTTFWPRSSLSGAGAEGCRCRPLN